MPRKLTEFETTELLEWFLHNMTADTRVDLMATYPLHYNKIYPGVNPSIISDMVYRELSIGTSIDNNTPNL